MAVSHETATARDGTQCGDADVLQQIQLLQQRQRQIEGKDEGMVEKSQQPFL